MTPSTGYVKTDLRCLACGERLGDNDQVIESGPHAGLRPTDLTSFCNVTGRREQVIELNNSNDGITSHWPTLSWVKCEECKRECLPLFEDRCLDCLTPDQVARRQKIIERINRSRTTGGREYLWSQDHLT